MKLRLADEPWGGARVAYAYLGVVVVAIGAGLLSVIAYAIVDATPACAADTTGYCMIGVIGIVAAVCLVGLLFLAAWIMHLGWQWAAWVVALTLLVGQLVVISSQVDWLILLLLVPACAALMTLAWPDRTVAPWLKWVRLVVPAIVLVEFVWWFVALATRA